MSPAFVRRSTTALLVAASLALAACGGDLGSDKLDDTHSGMPRDSVVALLGTGTVTATGNDTMRVVNGHHRQSYFVDGRNIEVIWYREQPGSVNDSITNRKDATPVVFTNDTLAGWGWKYYLGDGTTKLRLPNPLPAEK